MINTSSLQNVLTAGLYMDLPANTPVYNLNTITEYTYVDLPEKILSNYKIYRISELNTDKVIDLQTDVILDNKHPWIDFISSKLNLDIGKHIYKIELASYHDATDTICLYFGYLIQSDNPDRPYIYMKRS